MKLSSFSPVLGLVLMHFVSHTLAAADETPPAATKVTFLVIYRPGPAWLVGKPISEQPLKEHGKYMLSLYAKGSMKFAGPLSDNAGGAVVLEVADEPAARAIVMADPAVASGIFAYEMHPWELKPWDKYLQKK